MGLFGRGGDSDGPSTTNTRLFARRHHLAKPSAMQLKGWETAAPPLGSTRGRRAAAVAQRAGAARVKGGSERAAASVDPTTPSIPELPDPARGVYVRVPFAAEPTPLREFLWGLLQGTAELVAAVRAPFAAGAGARDHGHRRTLADKMPFWAEAMGDPGHAVALPPEQARIVRVAAARRAAAATASTSDRAKEERQGRGGRGEGGAEPPPQPLRSRLRPPPADGVPQHRPRLNAGFPSPGVGVVLLANAAAVWGVLHANPPF